MTIGKRDALQATAERLFYEEGFHATGIDRLVAEAGVARVTLYKHFPSKEALIEAILEQRSGRYLDKMQAAIRGVGVGSALAAMAACHCRWLRSALRASPSGCS